MANGEMMRSLVLEEIGPPDNLKVEQRPVPTPGDNEVLIKVELAGLIYADAEARRGTYFSKTVLPWRPGREAAGTIAALGKSVRGLEVGQRVAALVISEACQAEYVLASTTMDAQNRAPAEILPLPDQATYGQALVHLVNFRLAHMALHAWSSAGPDSRVLIHGASGGMGSVLTQLAHAHGCEVIVTCRNPEEVAFCRSNGADHIIDIDEGDYVAAVMAVTGGRGVKVVFNGIGGHTINKDPAIIEPFGELHLYGYVAGKSDLHPFEINRCLSLKTFSASDFFPTPAFATATKALYDRLASKEALDVTYVFPLEEAAKAHRLLDEGRVIGKIALKP
jgi:NADPH2:quinone reductase